MAGPPKGRNSVDRSPSDRDEEDDYDDSQMKNSNSFEESHLAQSSKAHNERKGVSSPLQPSGKTNCLGYDAQYLLIFF